MKVVLLGGGGFRTPMTYVALRRAARSLDLRELVLYDIAPDRLRSMQDVLEGLSRDSDHPLPVRATTDLADAVRGAAFVLCAIRVGGLQARVVDERVPQAEGVVGQETVGPGGLNLVLRSVPVMKTIAEVIAREAPAAWFINFTNPVGVISGVVRDVLGERVVGVCDTPAALCRRVAAVLRSDVAGLSFDYVGLNHLGWLGAVRDRHGRDLLPDLLADDAALAELEEARLFGPELIRQLGLIPNEYLAYYYYPQRLVQGVASAGHTRAEYLLYQQRRFYAAAHAAPEGALRAWRAVRAERDRSYMAEARPKGTAEAEPHLASSAEDDDGDGYAGVAVALVESLASSACVKAIVNVVNGPCLSFLPAEAFVELPCTIAAGTTVPPPVAVAVPAACRVLMQRVHSAEQMAVIASRTGSRTRAVEAMALHPLVDSADLAERIVDSYFRAQPELAALFA